MASRQRKKIYKFAEKMGIVIIDLQWEPIGHGGEKQGQSGGWWLHDSNGNDYFGYNVAELIKDMQSGKNWQTAIEGKL